MNKPEVNTVLDWLSAIGLERYGEPFADNDVDFDVLSQLTGDDLREIGVKSVGDRRRLLTAIQALGANTPQADEPEAAVVQHAQRRMLTVMFCDLVGSTALSSRTDPEEFLLYIKQFRQTISEAIAPYEAHIAQYAGDGILAYFGYPRSSDHDAEKAVAASLALLEAVDGLPHFDGERPQARIGLATGLTVVGGVERMREFMGDGAVGETLNLAARLQSLAEPGTIVIADSTRRMVGNTFQCAELGEHQLKGFDEPVEAFQILGSGAVESRFDALRSSQHQADFSGREAEVALLKAGLAESRSSRRVLFVSGEGGFGKSRLVREAIFEPEGGTPPSVLIQCSPYQRATEFFPLRYQLERAAGIAATDDPQTFVGKVTSLLERFRPVTQERLAVVANLLAVEGVAEEPMRGLNAYQKRQMALTHLSQILLDVLAARPMMLVEDAQWMDPSTGEVLDLVLAELAGKPGLVIVTSRPSILPEWVTAHAPQLIELRKLPNKATRDIVQSLLKDAPGSQTVFDAIVERSGGVPIFAEELTRNYLASGDAVDPARFLEEVPATLSETMLARLDRLEKGQPIASIAAAIGREFPIQILSHVADLPARVFDDGIEELKQAGIIEQGYSPFGEAIRFRQMLVRDAIYQMLLRRDRTTLHSRIVNTIREDFPDLAGTMPHVLAMQLSLAGKPEESALEWLRAGTLANQKSAYREAVQHLRSGLDAIGDAAETESTAKSEMSLRTTLIGALIASEGYSSTIVSEEIDRASEAGERFGSAEGIIASLFSKWAVMGARIGAMRDLADRMLETAEQGTDIDRLIARRSQATSLLFSAEMEPAIDAYHKFMEIYDEAEHGVALRQMHGDHALMVMMGLAEAYTLSGHPEKGREWGDRVLAAARKSQRAHDIAHVLAFVGCLHSMLVGDTERASRHGRELVEVCQENGISFWLGHGHLFVGLCAIEAGDAAGGFAEAEKGMGMMIESNVFSNCWQILQARTCIEHGRVERACELLKVAERSINQGDIRFAPEFHRVRARLYAAMGGEKTSIESELKRSLRLIRQQGTSLFLEPTQEDLENLLMSA